MRRIARLRATAMMVRELPAQRRIPFESATHLARRRDLAVRAAVTHAAAHVPHWRETFRRLAVEPSDIRTFADLARLPIVRREDVQRDPERFLTAGTRVADCLELRSSGTSGTPVTVWYDRRAMMAGAAHMDRQRRVVNANVGRRTGYMQANIVPSQSSAFGLSAAYFRAAIALPDRIHVKHEMVPFQAPLEEQVARLAELGAPVLGGFGSAVERVVLAGGYPGLKVVRFGADTFGSAARHAAEDMGLVVLGTYASVEAMRMGWECGAGPELHLNEDISPVRLVDPDGRGVPAGEPGQVVVSNLVNRASVLLNYLQGDLGVMGSGPCDCGRTLPLMTLVQGRADEYLVLGGHEVHPHALGGFATEGVRRFRLVQTVPDRLLVEVEPALGADPGGVRQRVERWCGERLGDGVGEVRLVDELRPGPNGKHRVVVGLGDAG